MTKKMGDPAAVADRQATAASGQGGLELDFGTGSGFRKNGAGSAPLPCIAPYCSYGKGGSGALVHYAVRESEVGLVLVAATSQGICFVALGNTVQNLARALGQELPEATVRAGQMEVQTHLEEVMGLLEKSSHPTPLPLDVPASPFQWRVWQELQRIPRGQTISYGELATRIGQPSAVRAVARANATNPVALIHPCHRVVGSAGKLTGFRWGIETKRQLLAKELEAERSGLFATS